MAWSPALSASAGPNGAGASPPVGPVDAELVDGLVPLGESLYSAHYSSPSVEEAVPSAGLGSRVLAALEGRDPDREIGEDLMLELGHVVSPVDLLWLLQVLAESLVLLRQRFCRSLGHFCLEAMRILARMRFDHWQGPTMSLRLLEGVVLICMHEPEDRPTLCTILQELLRTRFLSKAAARLESAIMSLGDVGVRSLYAPEKPFGLDLDEELNDLAHSVGPDQGMMRQRQKCFEIFGEVIQRCFSIKGHTFGSAVNGFQLTGSDIDISVLLPASVRDRLIADRHRQKAEGVNRPPPEAGAEAPAPVDWSFLATVNPLQAACVAAARVLAAELRKADIHVVDVVERARVPIIKCKHRVAAEPEDVASGMSTTDIEFEVDISFCNEVAYFNSRLLRAYAGFDQRCVAVCRLVKLWAKRRKVNSPFDGTLSSYSYSLLVIDYLQRQGLLPNLQRPRREVLEELGLPGVGTCLLDSGHNVWFLDPAEVRATREQLKADHDGSERDGPGAPKADTFVWCTAEERRWWLGADSPNISVYELFYGFMRFFALEFNFYSEVSSIRLPLSSIRWKVEYFLADAEGEDEEAEEAPGTAAFAAASPMVRAAASPYLGAAASPYLGAAESPYLGPTPYAGPHTAAEGVEISMTGLEMLPSAKDDGGDSRPRASDDSATGDEGKAEDSEGSSKDPAPSPPESVLEAAQAEPEAEPKAAEAEPKAAEAAEPDRAPQEATVGADSKRPPGPPSPPLAASDKHYGTCKSFNLEGGFGFIECEQTFAKYNRDVFLHQNQAGGTTVGDRVCFLVELNGKGQPQARQVRKVAADDTELPEPLPDPVAELMAAPLPPAPRPEMSRAAAVAQRRLKDRCCLCIDDPMEKHRTLGATFNGQDLISYELRRAVSLLKKGAPHTMEELFKEKEMLGISSKKRSWNARDFSPIPHQATLVGNHPDGRGRHVATIVEIERSVKKELVGRIIGSAGTTVKHIQKESGVEDVRVIDHKGGEAVVHVRGETERVIHALALVEQLQRSGKARAGATDRGRQQIVGPREPGLVEGPAPASSPPSMYPARDVARDAAAWLGSPGKPRSAVAERTAAAPAAAATGSIAAKGAQYEAMSYGRRIAAEARTPVRGADDGGANYVQHQHARAVAQARAAAEAQAAADAQAAAEAAAAERDRFLVVPPKIGAAGVMSLEDLEKNLMVSKSGSKPRPRTGSAEFEPKPRPMPGSPTKMAMMSCEDFEKGLAAPPKAQAKGAKEESTGRQGGRNKAAAGSAQAWLPEMPPAAKDQVPAPKAGAPGVLSCADLERRPSAGDAEQGGGEAEEERKRRRRRNKSSAGPSELPPEQAWSETAAPKARPQEVAPTPTAGESKKNKKKANKITTPAAGAVAWQ